MQPLDPDQLKFVEILAKLMMENEVFKEEYSEEDFKEVIDWLTKGACAALEKLGIDYWWRRIQACLAGQA